MRKRLWVAVGVAALLAAMSSSWARAHEPEIFTKTNGVNEITPALTKGTSTLEDDDGSDFVHEIQWDKVHGLSPTNWISVTETLDWVFEELELVDDATNYGVAEAWANPEQTLNQGSGDSEDLAFLLASLLKWHTDEVGPNDLIYVSLRLGPDPTSSLRARVVWCNVLASQCYWLNPETGEMVAIDTVFPLGTLWLNDEHVWGFLPGYYPAPFTPLAGYRADDFSPIAVGGFGDRMNTYPWSMALFGQDLYVGTARNFPWQLGEGLELIFGPLLELESMSSPSGEIGDEDWANDMAAEIWRHGSWERVYRSPVMEQDDGFFPRETGFRQMVTFDGAIYAAKGGYFATEEGLILKSIDGATWEHVETPPGMGTDTRAMAVHNGRLFVGTGGPGLQGSAKVWAYPSTDGSWEEVVDFTAIEPYTNSAVVSLASFNDHLYAGTQNLQSGYQVFRSDDANPELGWTQVISRGAGDQMNYWAGTMATFQNHLYVGSLSWPFEPAEGAPQVAAPKGFELIRIAPDAAPGEYDLIIGDYIPRLPPAGYTVRLPSSGWPGGFGNFLNLYCWSLEEHNGVLYLGTFDATSFLQFIPVDELIENESLAELLGFVDDHQEELLAALQQTIGLLETYGMDDNFIEPYRELQAALETEPIEWEKVWDIFIRSFAGADLWKSEDGIRWEPVTLNGFDNPNNYGVRNIVRSNPLYVGMANPFQGLEIWQAPVPAPVPAPVGGVTVAPKGTDLFQPVMYVAGLAVVLILGGLALSRRHRQPF